MRRYSEIKVGEFCPEGVAQFAAQIHRSPRFAQLLVNRGIDNTSKFLKWSICTKSQIADPMRLPDMDKAVALLAEAVANSDLVFVSGDYDVDGISATSIVVMALRELGVPVEYTLPSRFREGYGLHISGVDKALDLGAKIFMSVDCGSSNRDVVAYAREHGLKVIVTDHHEVASSSAPEAEAFVNPKRQACSDEEAICGAAVAWKVMLALYRHLHRPDPVEYLDLVALATISDMMPLRGESRLLCRLGLEEMAKWQRPGLRALGEVSGVLRDKLRASSVSYYMAPRLNSLGRLGEARPGVELFTSDDSAVCARLAELVQRKNLERRVLQDQMTDDVEAKLDLAEARRRGFIFAVGNYQLGVVGIGAGRLQTSYRMPCILCFSDGDMLRGSGRSPAGTNLYGLLSDCQEYLETFGGHASAGGLSLKTENLEPFLAKLEEVLPRYRGPVPLEHVDYVLHLNEIEPAWINELDELEPTGMQAPPPRFLLRGVRLLNTVPLGEGRFLRGTLVEDACPGYRLKAMAFSAAEDVKKYALSDQLCDVVCSLDVDTYNGDAPRIVIEYFVAANERQEKALNVEQSITDSAPEAVPPAVVSRPQPNSSVKQEVALSSSSSPKRSGRTAISIDKDKLTADGRGHTLVDMRGFADASHYAEWLTSGGERKSILAVRGFSQSSAPAGIVPAASGKSVIWREFVIGPTSPDYSDILLLDPPLYLQALRDYLASSSAKRIHLLYAPESWDKLARELRNWSLTEPLMCAFWELVRGALPDGLSRLDMSEGYAQRWAECLDSSPSAIIAAINVALEMKLLRRDEGPAKNAYRLGERSADACPPRWADSPSFVRFSQMVPRFEETRRLLDIPKLNAHLFWP